MLQCPFTKKFCLEFWTVNCVWMSNSSKSNLLYQGDVEIWDSHHHPSFPQLYPLHCQKYFFSFFCSFFKVFTLYISEKGCGKLTLVQTSTVPYNSVQVSCTQKCLLGGFALFGKTTWISWVLLSIKLPTPQYRLYLQGQYLVQCKTYKCRRSWKWKAERDLREGKRVVHSCDQTNMNFVLVQTFNSSRDLCPYVPALLQ